MTRLRMTKELPMAHGELIDGVWHTRFHNTKATGGPFQRGPPKIPNRGTADRRVGTSGDGGFPAARGRYHLYVSLACPWAHRTIVFRKLKGLEDTIGMTVVDPVRDERGWAFRDGPGHSADPINGFEFLSEAYHATD